MSLKELFTTQNQTDEEKTTVMVVHVHMPKRKDFMTMEELCAEIPYGKTWVLDKIKSGEFKDEEHYIRDGRKYVFYYPAVALHFLPKLAKV